MFTESRDPTMTTIGLDIGGANLKMADSRGRVMSTPFALWKYPDRLAEQLQQLREAFFARYVCAEQHPDTWPVGVTMTGELCDCFASKQEGVAHIVAQTLLSWPGQDVSFYQTTGRWVDADRASRDWSLTAASNWHALARYAARFMPQQSGILIDIGSTTTDVIPVWCGQPKTIGATDFSRIKAGELVYTGVVRSPICAVVSEVELDGRRCAPAHECFANMFDVYLLTGDLPESEEREQTMDGQPATRTAALRRLARMWCAEPTDGSEAMWLEVANQIKQTQFAMLRQSLMAVVQQLSFPVTSWLVTGQGDWLATQLARSIDDEIPLVRLSERFSAEISTAAPAFAVAALLAEDLRRA